MRQSVLHSLQERGRATRAGSRAEGVSAKQGGSLYCGFQEGTGDAWSACLGLVSLNNFFFNIFVSFWLRWVSLATRLLSLVAASRGYASLWCEGFSWR